MSYYVLSSLPDTMPHVIANQCFLMGYRMWDAEIEKHLHELEMDGDGATDDGTDAPRLLRLSASGETRSRTSSTVGTSPRSRATDSPGSTPATSVSSKPASSSSRVQSPLLGASASAPKHGRTPRSKYRIMCFEKTCNKGILRLGDDLPRDRTGELRALGFPTRHLDPVQMITDTALGVSKIIVADKIILDAVPYTNPTIRFSAKESV
ncbi:hypothetical protein FIBSPDRAFT_979058 [Athelia psychrophila]|uniref:Uncharacterized protein n=1 Tax=Athelia psychrophila TaxID=1759441 RepID=A0A166TQV8_9AGAM|nr:hypothetical protein FIBSPDRAFT_979058 [Fibularhizoctonia sp. CBS 109695]